MYVSLNHRLLDAADAAISVWDGGYLYGDGIYTTLRLYSGVPLDLDAHWGRLTTQAAALELPVPGNRDDLAATIGDLAARNGLADRDGRVRVTVSRGGSPEDPLPLTGLDRIESTLLVTAVPVSPHQRLWQDDGIGVITLDAAFSRGNIPEIKTLNTLPALLAQRRAAAAGCHEAILTGDGGVLLEGATSNVFLVTGGRLRTPAVGAGFLAGLTREKVMRLACELGLNTCEEELRLEDLAAAEEVFVVGSVREVVPVVRIDARPVGDGLPGPLTRRIQDGYREMIRRLLDAAPG